MIFEMILSGFLFLFIIFILNLASERFGHETFSDLDSDAKLQKINNDPKKFKISIVLALIEHVSIISLTRTQCFYSRADETRRMNWRISFDY